MKFGVVVFPGSSGAGDVVYTLEEVMQLPVSEVGYKQSDLSFFSPGDCLIIPGGAAYGDPTYAGICLERSPIFPAIAAFAEAGGLVVGLGDGFQLLCQSGLLPGSLDRNASGKFICRHIHCQVRTNRSAVTAALLPGDVLTLPIAHGYGRYTAPEETIAGLFDSGQVLLQYCNPEGVLDDASNPSGSTRHIAGITNAARNVFGLLPYPERAAEELGGPAHGRLFFESLLRTAKTTSAE